VALLLRTGEDAIEGDAHRAGQTHVVEHVLRAHAAVHDVEARDVDAVDLRGKDALFVTEEVRRQGPEVDWKALDPKIAGLDQMSICVASCEIMAERYRAVPRAVNHPT